MQPLMNHKLDHDLIKQNQRLSYFTKIANGIQNESVINKQQLIKTFINESHIPNYMYQEDVKEVKTFIRRKQSKYVIGVIISLLILFASIAIVTYSQLTETHKLIGIMAIFVAPIAFSSFLIVNDKLFIPKNTLKNIKDILNLITSVGETHEQTN